MKLKDKQQTTQHQDTYEKEDGKRKPEAKMKDLRLAAARRLKYAL